MNSGRCGPSIFKRRCCERMQPISTLPPQWNDLAMECSQKNSSPSERPYCYLAWCHQRVGKSVGVGIIIFTPLNEELIDNKWFQGWRALFLVWCITLSFNMFPQDINANKNIIDIFSRHLCGISGVIGHPVCHIEPTGCKNVIQIWDMQLQKILNTGMPKPTRLEWYFTLGGNLAAP